MMPENVCVSKHVLRNGQVRSGKLGNSEQEIENLHLFFFFLKEKGHGTAHKENTECQECPFP